MTTAAPQPPDLPLRLRAVRSALDAETLVGHPEISWSVVMAAALVDPVPADVVRERVGAAFEPNPGLGPVPAIEPFRPPSADPTPAFDAVANAPYSPQGPLVRILSLEDPPYLVMATHHAALDGLGLLALLGTALGSPASSDVRGLPSERAGGGDFLRSAIGRLREAALAPPSRVAAAGGTPRASGDWLLSRRVAGTPPPIGSVAAAVIRAIRRWNLAKGERSDRIVLAVGASLRPGSNLRLEDRSGYLRLPVHTDDPTSLAAAIRSAPLQPDNPSPLTRRLLPMARPVVRLLAPRLGSTAFISSLGQVNAPPLVREINFFPVAHGVSSVSVGMCGMGGADGWTVVTLRCGRRRFSEGAAAALADSVAEEMDKV